MNPSILITLIDDNPGSLEMTAAACSKKGLEIRSFEEPEAAMEFILNHHPQIVITDLMMPHLSGMEVLERVMEFDPSIDVLLVTAHYTTESAVEAIKKGAADYLNKPVSLFQPPSACAPVNGKAPALPSGPPVWKPRWPPTSSLNPWWATARPCGNSFRKFAALRRTIVRSLSKGPPAPARNWWPAPCTC